MMASLVNSDLKTLGAERKPTKGNDGPDKGMKRICSTIESLLDNEGVKLDEIAGIGMACPGVVDLKTGVLRRAPNLGWEEMPIGKELEKKFGVPVYVLNDVDAGAYGEYAAGAGKDASTLVAVFPGTGIGAGCVFEGEMLTGKRASCMELGNTRFPVVGLNGEVGEAPRLESICGRLGIASAAVVEVYRGNAPTLKELAGTDLTNIKSGSLAKAIEGGDKAIEEIIKNAAHYLGISIAGVVDLLGPDLIVLGGGLVEKMPKLFLDGVKKAINLYASPTLANEVSVKEAKLGDDAVVIGAAAYGMKHEEKRNAESS